MRTLLLLSFLFTFSTLFSQSPDHDLVKKTFADYKSAVLTDQAQKALNAVDSRTRTYYAEILAAVKTSDSAKINALSIVDKITILGIRAKASKEELLKMQGYDAFLFAINNGMVGKNGVAANTLGEITIADGFAKAQLLASGQKTPYYFHFYKEEGQWKLDITSLFYLTQPAFQKMIDESGLTENEFLLKILSALAGKEIGNEIWKPLSQ